MIVVIIGAKERKEEEDRAIVYNLMQLAATTYPSCVFATVLTHEGVGQFVKEKCLEKDDRHNFRYQLVECVLHLYAKFLNKAEVSQIYLTRNATLFELGDIFVYLAGRDRKGMMEDLIVNRVIPAGRPCVILGPGEPARLPNV